MPFELSREAVFPGAISAQCIASSFVLFLSMLALFWHSSLTLKLIDHIRLNTPICPQSVCYNDALAKLDLSILSSTRE